MFIRYNQLAKYFEFDASGGLGAGPWIKLQIDYSQIINIPAGSVAPHATTHNTGGSDPITALSGGVITTGTVADARLSSNVALLDRSNQIFTGLKQRFSPSVDLLDNFPQLSGALPAIHFIESDQPVDSRIVSLVTQNNSFAIQARTDAFGFIRNLININRANGELTVTSHIINGGYIYPGRVDAPGASQVSWILASHASYGLYTNTGLYVHGPIWANTSIYERGRSIPQGEWTAFAPVITSDGTYPSISNRVGRYTLIGKTCHFQAYFQFEAASTPGTGNWHFGFPVPASSALVYYTTFGTAIGVLSGVFKTGVLIQSTNPPYFHIVNDGSGNLWGGNKPAAWVPGDILRISGTYEIA